MSGFDLSTAAHAAVAFRDTHDWAQFHAPKNVAAGISIEAGELLEVFLWDAVRSAQEIQADEAVMTRVREELADVLIYSLTLSHDLSIDLSAAIFAKIERNGERYRVDEARGSVRKALHDSEGRE